MAEENDKKENKSKDKGYTLKVEKLYPNAPLPVKPTIETDAGFDVFAHNVKRVYANYGSNTEKELTEDDMFDKFPVDKVLQLGAGERALIGTGLKMTVGSGYEIQVRPRSGLALKQGLTIVNSPGTVDEAYRGEVGVIILNTSNKPQQIKLGDRIAQVVPKRVELMEIQEIKLDDRTDRGTKGYGASDQKRNKRDENKPIDVMGKTPLTVIDPSGPFNMM